MSRTLPPRPPETGTPAQGSRHRQRNRATYLRRRLFVALGGLTVVLLAVAGVMSAGGTGRRLAGGPAGHRSGNPAGSAAAHGGTPRHGRADPPTGTGGAGTTAWLPPPAPGAKSYLAPGSDPSVLPGPILIADKGNSRLIVVDPQGRIRWVWPRPGDLAPGQTFKIPDDAFFTPDGRQVIATQEDDYAITLINLASRRIVWRYGHPGVPGAGPDYVYNPDDAMVLPSGEVVSADIKNCRIIKIAQGTHRLAWHEGIVGSCIHNPPTQLGSPNGFFPLPNGTFLVTEINGDWVDNLTAAGRVLWATHPPGVAYPSDSNQIGPDRYLTVDYSDPGQVVIFNRAGKTLWRWRRLSGNGRLDQPSLAMGLPNGDILMNDDYNDRVIVIDPRTNRIVWQYGHTGVPGSRPGYLNIPDGLDPLPPYSYADRYDPRSG